MQLPIHTCLLFFLLSCAQTNADKKPSGPAVAQTEQDPCDDPDAGIDCCFANMPAGVGSIMTIAGVDEPGERMVITGTILKPDGKTPYAGVTMYAYQTDHKGYYSKTGNEKGVQKWHGHLYGWCKTGADGRYEIRTIRPARYPDNSMPAHIHAAIKEPGNTTPYYISDFVFKDDSLVNSKYLRSMMPNAGGTGVVEVSRSADSTWSGQRDLVTIPR